MTYFEGILLAAIQGLTEFVPVSSTAHLKVVSLLFGVDDPGPSLSAIIQFGSVLALVWYFKNDFFKANSNFKTISMGMSQDYEIAIQEGSNMIRVGSALFGKR